MSSSTTTNLPAGEKRDRSKFIHGKIRFKDEFSAGGRAVIVDYEKEYKEVAENKRKEIARQVVEFFKTKWNIKEPGLIITVTGGAGVFKLNPKLRQVFRRGLVEAAKDAEAVILTGGTHSGVMKHTGKAMQENSSVTTGMNVPCIGFTSFSSVNHSENMEKFLNSEGKKKYSVPAKKRAKHRQKFEYDLGTKQRSKEKEQKFSVDLDPNHSYHVLIKNGSENSIDGQIGFWGDIETAWREERCRDYKKIARTDTNKRSEKENQKLEDLTNRTNIPGVLICLQGGPGTVETCFKGLTGGTPLVVVQDSGRCADWIANAVLFKRENYSKSVKGDEEGDKRFAEYEKKVRTYYEEMLKLETGLKEAVKKKIMPMLMKIATEYHNLVEIFQLNSKEKNTDFNSVIMKAVIKNTKQNKDDFKTKGQDLAFDQLLLALKFKQMTLFKEVLDDLENKLVEDSYEILLKEALMRDQPEFLELLMNEDNASAKTELSIITNLYVYSLEKNPKGMLVDMLTILKKEFKKHEPLNTFRKTITKKLSHYQSGTAIDAIEEENGQLILRSLVNYHKDLFGAKYNSIYQKALDECQSGNGVLPENAETTFQSYVPFLEFCLLTGRFSSARQILIEQATTYGEGTVCALGALRILQSMAPICATSVNLDDKVNAEMEYYTKFTVRMVKEAYSRDKNQCCQILIKKNEEWGDYSCFELGISTECYELVKTEAWQDILDEAWYDWIPNEGSMMNLSGGSKIKKILSWFLIIAMWFLMVIFYVYVYNIITYGGFENSSQDVAFIIIGIVMQFIFVLSPPLLVGEYDSRAGFFFINQDIEDGYKEIENIDDESDDEEEAVETEVTDQDKKERPAEDGTTWSEYLNTIFFIKINNFYRAPVTIFIQSTLSSLVLLALFCDLLIFRSCYSITSTEYLVMFWIIVLILEEIRQVFRSGTEIDEMLKGYFSDTWNLLDLVFLFSYFFGFFIKLARYSHVENTEKYWLEPCDGQISNFNLTGNQQLVHIPFFLEFIEGYTPDHWMSRNKLMKLNGDYYSCDCPASLSFEDDRIDGSLWDIEMFYTLSFFFMCIRLLNIFTVTPQLGPLIIAIKTMLVDLSKFIFIIVIFIIGYGVVVTSMRYPNDLHKDISHYKQVLINPYFQILGEMTFLDDGDVEPGVNCVDGKDWIYCKKEWAKYNSQNCREPVLSNNFTNEAESSYDKFNFEYHGVCPLTIDCGFERCQRVDTPRLEMMGVLFMMLMNVLVMNLLIAVFSTTYENVQEKSDGLWKFQRTELIIEYKDKSKFPVPLSLVYRLCLLIKHLFIDIPMKCYCCKKKNHEANEDSETQSVRENPEKEESLAESIFKGPWERFLRGTAVSKFRLEELKDGSETEVYFSKLRLLERVCAEQFDGDDEKTTEELLKAHEGHIREIHDKLDNLTPRSKI